ncbi:phosphate ABC transporter substrate-binding protein [Clostridium swellfunianum]|uniref:phosphate ABC transporter substrate-binding protein n=1 Tax=Clostridium swellfunianum TaxID=1367462 RepID=UPI00202FBC66|nr:phosphate ABC transporter substrate-binding protein [Clostridium swellfunianum]MCM0647891.1 phosphate ABC transporter substrate-binding protein [Clostridium swellfunianum]
MKLKKSSVAAVFLSIVFSAGVLTGCGSELNKESSSELSGTITASGSTALQPLAEQVANKFVDQHPEVTINVQGGGSGTGLAQVLQGAVDIGNSDIFAEEKLKPEQSKTLVDHKVAVVGIAAVVNNKVNIDNISKENLIKIFTGQVTNWKEVGGSDMRIQLINRPKSSGTRATFKKYGLDNKEEAEGSQLQQDSSGAVRKAIEATDGAISYLAIPYLTEEVRKTIKVINLDNVEPTNENIANGNYPIWSYEHMYSKGQATGLAKLFLEYIVSDEAKPIIKFMKYVPISEMKVTR